MSCLQAMSRLAAGRLKVYRLMNFRLRMVYWPHRLVVTRCVLIHNSKLWIGFENEKNQITWRFVVLCCSFQHFWPLTFVFFSLENLSFILNFTDFGDFIRWILDDIICLHFVSNCLLRWAKMSSLHCNSFPITMESQCNVLIWAGNLKQNINK